MIPASARVYIQVRETGEIIEMEDFITVSSSVSVDGDSNCSVDIVNKADKWYNFGSLTDRRQTDVAQYLLQIYQTSRMKEITRELQARTQEALQATSTSAINTKLGE